MIKLKKILFESATDSPEFKSWFSGSKVVDKDGNPLVVFHGTDSQFDSFDNSKLGSRTDPGFFGAGHYFVSDRNNAQNWGKYVKAAYLSIKNPLYVNGISDFVKKSGMKEIGYMSDKEKYKQLYRAEVLRVTGDLRKKGFDGVIYDRGNGKTQYIVFDASDIKCI